MRRATEGRRSLCFRPRRRGGGGTCGGEDSLRGRARRFVRRGRAQLRRHPAHASGALLDVHRPDRARRSDQGRYRSGFRANCAHPGYEGHSDGVEAPGRTRGNPHCERHASGNARRHRPVRHDGTATIRRRHSGNHRRHRVGEKNLGARHHHHWHRCQIAAKAELV